MKLPRDMTGQNLAKSLEKRRKLKQIYPVPYSIAAILIFLTYLSVDTSPTPRSID